MKIPREDREALIKRIKAGEITVAQAAQEYGVYKTAIYQMLKRAAEPRPEKVYKPEPNKPTEVIKKRDEMDIEAYRNMTKEELIDELILAKANELRAKKGYEVRGVGANKEFIFLNNENSK